MPVVEVVWVGLGPASGSLSGLNAGWSLDRMAEEFARLRDATEQVLRYSGPS